MVVTSEALEKWKYYLGNTSLTKKIASTESIAADCAH